MSHAIKPWCQSKIRSRVARSGARQDLENRSNSLRLGSADAVLVLALPVTGTSSDIPSAHTAMAAAQPGEIRHSADFAAPESRRMCCPEVLKQSLIPLHGPTWQSSRSGNKKAKS